MAAQGSTGLRRGSTTAACAAVAARAAFSARPSAACPNPVSMRLRRSASAQFGLALAASRGQIAVATGATCDCAVPRFYGLPGHGLIGIGNVAGGTLTHLRYLRTHPIKRPPIAAGFTKLAKPAAGHRDLHSGRSRADLGALAERLVVLGADAAATKPARAAVGAGEFRARTARCREPLAADIASRAREVTWARLSGETAVEVAGVNRRGGVSAPVGS
jgi:cobalamin biosynthesis protein CbiD